MKLFYYDSKHQQVVAQKDMGNLTESEIELVDKVIDFLEEKNIIDGRYKNLVLAHDMEVVYEDGEPQLVIKYA